MGAGQHAERQLGLGADGVEARRVENDQALFQQGMGEIDQCMAPFRDLHDAIRICHRIVIGRVVVPETKGSGFVLGNLAYFGNFFERLGQLRLDAPALVTACGLALRRFDA